MTDSDSDSDSDESVAAAGGGEPLVSVVVACFRRTDGLARLLESLGRQTYAPIEVVVVDQTGEDELAQIAAASPVPTRYLRWTPPGSPRQAPGGGVIPPSNASGARNFGVMAAAGDLVATTDDDCVAQPDWIEHLTEPMRADPDVIMVTGANVVEDSQWDTAVEVRAAGRRHPQLTWNQGGGSSLAFRREVFIALGGFDMTVGPGTTHPGAEDSHLIYRALDYAAQHGLIVAGRTDARVADDLPADPVSFVRRNVRYWGVYGEVLRREYERHGDVIARDVFRTRWRNDLGPFFGAFKNLSPRWVVAIAAQHVSFAVGWVRGASLAPFHSDVSVARAAEVRAATAVPG